MTTQIQVLPPVVACLQSQNIHSKSRKRNRQKTTLPIHLHSTLTKPTSTKFTCILDSEISIASDTDLQTSETLLDRLAALVDIVPPATRAKIASTSSTIASLTGSAFSFTGKSLWVVSTSVLLLGIPYALALGQEQEIMEREREEGLMREGASSVSATV